MYLEAAVVRAREDPAALHVDGAHPGDVAVQQLGEHDRPVWQQAGRTEGEQRYLEVGKSATRGLADSAQFK